MTCVITISFYYDRDEAVLTTDEGRLILTLKDAKELAIKQGDVLDDELLELIKQKDENLRCLKKLLGTVSRTNISKRRLMYKYKNDFSVDAIEFAVQKLEASRYINDSEFAIRQAQLLSKRLLGKSRIINELRAKGFESDDIETAIEEIEFAGIDNIENMLLLLQRRYRTKPFEKPKAYVFLRSRGFDGDEIKAAINRYLEDNEENEDDEDNYDNGNSNI